MLTKKSVPIIVSLPSILFMILVYASSACYQDSTKLYSYCEAKFHIFNDVIFPVIAYLTVPMILFPALFLVSIFAYFTREEVHSFWFKWMVKWYLPITTALILLTYLGESGGGGSLGAVSGISGTFVLAVLFSLLFIIISLILIVAKSVSLRKGNK